MGSIKDWLVNISDKENKSIVTWSIKIIREDGTIEEIVDVPDDVADVIDSFLSELE